MKTMSVMMIVAAAFGLTQSAQAGVGCDFNLRINNKTPNAIMIFWNPIDHLQDAVLDGEGSGAASHTKQAVELELPCWTGKVDFRIRYLDGGVERWKARRDVKIKSGDTVNINIP
jgi:hypothetical protein